MNKRLLQGLAGFLVFAFTSMLFLPQQPVVAVDEDPPTVVISSTESDPTNADPIPVTFTFSEDVFGFAEADIDVENGEVDLGSLSGSGDEYTVDIIPVDDGEVSVDVPADVCEDAAANGNLAAETFTITYDSTKPQPILTSEPNPTKTAPIQVTIDFGEPVGDLLLSEINVTGTYLGLALSPLVGPAQIYTLTITPDEDEVFEIQIPADVVEDAAGNPNLASVLFEVEFDTTSPAVEIDSPAFPSTSTAPIPVTITFAEPVTGFFASEIEVNNGNLSLFGGGPSLYTAQITPITAGPVKIDVNAGVAADAAGNLNTAAESLEVIYDTGNPYVTVNQAISQEDPTSDASIEFTVLFSEDVEDFDDPGDVNLSASTAPGTLAALITGSDDTYTVSVSGMTGSGTVVVTIPAGAALAVDPPADRLNEMSSSEDNLVTYTYPAPGVVSIQRISTNPSNAMHVDFLVTFSEAVVGVDQSDFTLTTTGSIAGAGVSAISGSGSTRIVSVATGTGSGTLRLDISALAEIEDLDGYQLGGLPYTAGEVYEIRTQSFTDVPTTSIYWSWIERLYDAGITAGCQVTPEVKYCPDLAVTRAQMAIFLERGMRGAAYDPPDASGTVFDDVADDDFAAAWIEKLAADGITAGCQTDPPLYCPTNPVTRAQMAIFLLRAKYGPAYEPDPVGGSTGFADVAPDDFAAAWIKQLAAEGITAGCGGGNYCPNQAVTRAQMAVFLVRTFELP